ncbi:MAG: glycosyltransferase family 4 protein [Myxococcota bacterium]|nr:glycosyltransferase family 4 protein [Myxococcota bacterium]
MRILFISHYFPPEVNAPASRTHEHCRRWVAEGHEVTVITGVPNHPAGAVFEGFRNAWIQEEEVDGIRVIRTWMFLAANAGFAKRILNYVLFGVTALIASGRVSKPDLVVATTPQFFCGLSGALIARLKRRPFVLEVRDLWPKSIVELGQLKPGLILRTLEGLENWLYSSATGIVVNTRAFIEHITARGYPREKIELVYNGIDHRQFKPRPPAESLIAANDLEGKTSVAYIGTLGLAHGLESVIDAAQTLQKEPDITFLLIGDGAERGKLEESIAERGIKNIKLLGLQPREKMPDWIASIDILLVCLKDLPVFETVIPSKIFEFLAQERPVIVSARGEIRRMTEEAGAGWTIDPEDPQALAECIMAVIRNPEEAQQRAKAGRLWIEREFVRDTLAMRMLTFMQEIVRGAK